MILQNQNILFFTRTMKLGGTENVVLQLCEIFKPLVNRIVVCSCGGVNVGKLTELGIRHYQIPDIEQKKAKQMLEVVYTLRRILKDEQITVIHTHHRMAAFYVAVLGLYKKCIFINTSHNTFTNRRCLTRFAYKHANLIACGEMVKKNLVEEYGLPDSQVTVIHNAVKPFHNDIVDEPLIRKLHEGGYFVIGNVGRLSKQKGMEYYIRSIPEVISHHPNARFLIIGSGEDEKRLKRMAEKLRIDPYLTFMGYRSDIQNLMTQMDLIVLSSLWEGLPLTPIEAFSVEKTIVATAVDGTTEIVRDSIDGLLVKPQDESAIAEKICHLMEHPEEKRRQEANARKRYEDNFSFNRLAKAYVEYYEGL